MAESGIKSYFPSQTVSDAEKLSYDYGLKIGKAIETEWFNNDTHESYVPILQIVIFAGIFFTSIV